MTRCDNPDHADLDYWRQRVAELERLVGDETRAQLRRLVAEQAAALRETAAQRDALAAAAKVFATAVVRLVPPEQWDGAIAAKLCDLTASLGE